MTTKISSAGQRGVRQDRRRIGEQKQVLEWEATTGQMLGSSLKQLSYSKKLLLSRYDREKMLQISEFLEAWFRIKKRTISYRKLKDVIDELEE